MYVDQVFGCSLQYVRLVSPSCNKVGTHEMLESSLALVAMIGNFNNIIVMPDPRGMTVGALMLIGIFIKLLTISKGICIFYERE